MCSVITNGVISSLSSMLYISCITSEPLNMNIYIYIYVCHSPSVIVMLTTVVDKSFFTAMCLVSSTVWAAAVRLVK